MDEDYTIRTKLIKSNINIKHIDFDNNVLYFDFSYRPHSGAMQKWSSTFYIMGKNERLQDAMENINSLALELRMILEN